MKITNECLLYAYEKGYRVDNEGYALNPSGEKMVCNKTKYKAFNLRFRDSTYQVKLHRLQAYQKYGDAIFEPGIVVRHKNGIEHDCSFDNILIGTYSDNAFDRDPESRQKQGKLAASYLKKYDNQLVKDFHAKHRSYKKTKEEFGISSSGTLNYILRN